jgi:hypothetical protein
MKFARGAISSAVLLFSLLISNVSAAVCPRTNSTISLYQTALVIATSAAAADEAMTILNGYGQPAQFLQFNQNGTSLPTLETIDATGNSVGNYGLIVIVGMVVYNFGGTTGWVTAITPAQWNTLYAYQLKYNVRMVHLDGFPGWFNDTTLAPGPGGCCSTEDQKVYLVNTTFVPTAGLKVAQLSTNGLWHYPSVITNTATTSPFLQFAPNTEYPSTTVAGVIQNFAGRQQMIFFLDGGSWSLTTNYLGHVWFHWGYRGLYNGFRRVALDMQSISPIPCILICSR